MDERSQDTSEVLSPAVESLDPAVALDPAASALARYARFQREFVEGFGICPWATKVREDGRFEAFVSAADPSFGAAPPDEDAQLRADAAAIVERFTDDRLDVAVMVRPFDPRDRVGFEQYTGRLRDALPPSLAVALAAFHPWGLTLGEQLWTEAAAGQPVPAARWLPVMRATPDPSIQIVRLEALAHVRKGRTSGTEFINLSAMSLDEPSFERWIKTQTPTPLHELVGAQNGELMNSERGGRVLACLREIHDR